MVIRKKLSMICDLPRLRWINVKSQISPWPAFSCIFWFQPISPTSSEHKRYSKPPPWPASFKHSQRYQGCSASAQNADCTEWPGDSISTPQKGWWARMALNGRAGPLGLVMGIIHKPFIARLTLFKGLPMVNNHLLNGMILKVMGRHPIHTEVIGVDRP